MKIKIMPVKHIVSEGKVLRPKRFARIATQLAPPPPDPTPFTGTKYVVPSRMPARDLARIAKIAAFKRCACDHIGYVYKAYEPASTGWTYWCYMCGRRDEEIAGTKPVSEELMKWVMSLTREELEELVRQQKER